MEEETCPICLHNVSLISSPCSHRACRECFERILLSCKNDHFQFQGNSIDRNHIDDAIVNSCPTRGRCPICRQCIDMFDLKDFDGKFVFEKNLLIPKDLRGMSFSNEDHDLKILFSQNPLDPPKLEMKNNDTPNQLDATEVVFDEGYHFHVKSNTLIGTVTLQTAHLSGTVDQLEIIAQFSQDFRYIVRGIIIKYRDFSTENIHSLFPLDGKWVVRWQKSSDRGKDRNELDRALINVSGNQFSLYGHSYSINLGDANEPRVHFNWNGRVDENTTQVAESGVDLIHQNAGPGIGDTIVWKVNHPDIFRIFWTRESIEIPQSRSVQKLGRSGMLFKRDNNCSAGSKPCYHGNSLWGNVFIQALKVGLASYHFISIEGAGENGSYISYENVDCYQWPPLDDGTPVPPRVPFIETSFDSESRTFRGVIPWKECYGSSWNGSCKWIYEITFDTEYIAIISGSVKDINEDGALIKIHKYNEDLIYINAALIERINSATHREEHSDTVDSINDDAGQDGNSISRRALQVRNEIMSIKTRLTDEGASRRTLQLIFEGSRGALLPGLDVIDYNL